MMQPLHVVTPLIRSEKYAKLKGDVFLKLENLQPSGSFKIRGVGNLCQHVFMQGAQHVVSSSGGNAGLAAAYAARKLGIKATVVVPQSTSPWAQLKIRQQGAKLIIHGKSWAQADDLAQELSQKKCSAYLPPFDHPQIFKGNSTIATELQRQIKKPSAIVLSVGGGGLLCGVVAGLQSVGWNDVKIYAAETEGAASLHAALKADQPIDIGTINTVAVTLGASEVALDAFLACKSHPVISKTVSDMQALQATVHFADEHRMMVEPSCGAALSLLENDRDVAAERSVVVIVCGGSGVTIDLLHSWQKKQESAK